MSKRPRPEQWRDPIQSKRSRSAPVQELITQLSDPEVRLRSLAVSGLVNVGEREFYVREALQQRLWIEKDSLVSQQILHALVSTSTPALDAETGSILQRFYGLQGCSDMDKVCVLALLHGPLGKSVELRNDVEERMVMDLDKGNPVLRSWSMKFLVKYCLPQELVIKLLARKLFDAHGLVKRSALELVMSLSSLGYHDLDRFQDAVLRLLRDSSETLRFSAMQLLRRWILAVEDMKEKEQALEKRMNYSYLQVCTMVSDACMLVREEACGLLAKMTSVNLKVKLHSVNKRPVLAITDDLSFLDSKDTLPLGTSAGVFVSALEDEFPEVRCAAIKALTSLSFHSKELLESGVLALLLDMLNDQHVSVRNVTLQALSQLVDEGLLNMERRQLQVVAGVLEDSDKQVRAFGAKLLSSMKLPSISLFNFVIQTLMSSLQRHLQDKNDIYEAFARLGSNHRPHVEACFASGQIQSALNEKDLDDPKATALIHLLAATARSTSWLPSETLSCAKVIELDAQEKSVTIESSTLQLVIERALSVRKSEQALNVISACKKALDVLEPSPRVNLASLYLECLGLAVQLSKGASSDEDHQRLSRVLGSMQVCFSGFTACGTRQLLELDIFQLLIQLSLYAASSEALFQLSWLVNAAKHSATEFTAIIEEQLRCSPPDVNILASAAKSFWPTCNILCEGIKEMIADLEVPITDAECKLKFIPAFPFQLQVKVKAENVTSDCRLWIETAFDGFLPQYSFLETEGRDKLEVTQTVDYYDIPLVVNAIFRVRVVVELRRPGILSPAGSRGPGGSVVPISTQRTIHLQADHL